MTAWPPGSATKASRHGCGSEDHKHNEQRLDHADGGEEAGPARVDVDGLSTTSLNPPTHEGGGGPDFEKQDDSQKPHLNQESAIVQIVIASFFEPGKGAQ